MDSRLADSFLTAARVAADLVRRPEVERRWEDESACEGMTVGGLACHLADQAGNTRRLLLADPGADPPIALAEHYRLARWVTAGVDEEPNTSIRDQSEEQARGGPEALVERVAADLEALPALLAAPREPDTVHVTWQGWSLATADFLVSRMMEIVVHTDDLATSVDLPVPEFPHDVVEPVLGLLTGIAVRRHGQTALVRALTRPQRAPRTIAAF